MFLARKQFYPRVSLIFDNQPNHLKILATPKTQTHPELISPRVDQKLGLTLKGILLNQERLGNLMDP
jgi:predicted nucleotide-binding protein (sugar kinase/HSP70/actin superfamily)